MRRSATEYLIFPPCREGIAHEGQGRFDDEVDDELHLVARIRSRALSGGIRVHQRLEAAFMRAVTPPQRHTLLAEEVGLRLLFENVVSRMTARAPPMPFA
jgi:hypothetical protein